MPSRSRQMTQSDYREKYQQGLVAVRTNDKMSAAIRKELTKVVSKQKSASSRSLMQRTPDYSSLGKATAAKKIQSYNAAQKKRIAKAMAELEDLGPQVRNISAQAEEADQKQINTMRKVLIAWFAGNYPRDITMATDDTAMVKDTFRVSRDRMATEYEQSKGTALKEAGAKRGFDLAEKALAEVGSNVKYVFASFGFYNFIQELASNLHKICDAGLSGINGDVIVKAESTLYEIATTTKNPAEAKIAILRMLATTELRVCNAVSADKRLARTKELEAIQQVSELKDKINEEDGVFNIFFTGGAPVITEIRKAQLGAQNDINSGLSTARANALAYRVAATQIPKKMSDQYAGILGAGYGSVFNNLLTSFISGSGIMDCKGMLVSLYDFFPGSRLITVHENVRKAQFEIDSCEKSCTAGILASRILPPHYIIKCQQGTTSGIEITGAPPPPPPPIPGPPPIPVAPPL
jgi:hypothetical protein